MDKVKEATIYLDDYLEVTRLKFCLSDSEVIWVLSQMVLSRYNRYAETARVERSDCFKDLR
jgi:hypothetical protein